MKLEFKDGRVVDKVTFYRFIQSRGLYEAVYETASGGKRTLTFMPKEAYVIHEDERDFLE